MKILHIVEDFSIKSGGLRTAIKSLDTQLKKRGYKSYILSSEKEKEDAIFLVKSSNKWLYSKEWKHKIHELVTKKNIDIIHIHGVWLYPQLIGAIYAVKNKIPFVLSCHGMYQPWLWKKGTLKKKIYFSLLSKKWFSKANVIHTITENEEENLKKLFKHKDFIEIPNLISFKKDLPINLNGDKYILYLGRLNKTKGIDLLIQAFSEIDTNSYKLKIAGKENNYKKELEKLIIKLKLTNKVEFLGMLKGREKETCIQNAWCMVSPTYSDVIGMVNLEAALFKTPMITTYNTGLKEEWNVNGGILIEPKEKALKNALIESLEWTIKERNEKGEQLFNFVRTHYSWETRLNDWEKLYKSII
jgi:glycosyltransferase involved in cell wall biosynthesis